MQAEFRNLAVALVGVVVACGAMAEEIVDFARGPMKGRRWKVTPQGVKIGRDKS